MKTRFDELAEDLPSDNSKIPWYPGCKGCMFAEDDGRGTGFEKGMCMMFPNPEGKPHRLAHEGKCEYYTDDE